MQKYGTKQGGPDASISSWHRAGPDTVASAGCFLVCCSRVIKLYEKLKVRRILRHLNPAGRSFKVAAKHGPNGRMSGRGGSDRAQTRGDQSWHPGFRSFKIFVGVSTEVAGPKLCLIASGRSHTVLHKLLLDTLILGRVGGLED